MSLLLRRSRVPARPNGSCARDDVKKFLKDLPPHLMNIPKEEVLLEAACHIGHPAAKWNPKMKPYLYGIQNGTHIFDLNKTKNQLEECCNKLADLQKKGKAILFVSTKLFSTALLEELGKETGHPIVTKKWIPGLITNWKTISRRIKYYLDLQKQFQTGEVEKYTKKEQLDLRKKLTQLDRALAGVAGMTKLPDAIFVVDALRDKIAVKEANVAGIPVFGICDSMSDPDSFTVAVPANDDASASVKLILKTVQDVLQEAASAPPEPEEKIEKENKEPSEEVEPAAQAA